MSLPGLPSGKAGRDKPCPYGFELLANIPIIV